MSTEQKPVDSALDSPFDSPPDPALCPLCGTDNACGNLQQKDNSPCWCANSSLSFPEELLNQIPDEARGKACVCRACATVVS